MSVSLNEGLERLLDNNTCEEQKRKQKKLSKEESVGEDVARYQKWVDYDMKRYGEVSEKTKDSLEKAGLSLVKDQYGEYEVIADEKIHESCNCKKRFLKEGASNFYSMSNFPLLIFGDDEDVYDRVWDMTKEELGGKVDDDEIDQTEEFENNWKTYFDYCTLSPEEQSELQDELKEINDKLETLRYTKEDELDSDFEIAKIEIRPGYYEALQLFVPDEKYLEDWQIDAINDALDKLKKEYGLTELGVSWRASNGETGYKKVESLQDTLGKDFRKIALEDDDTDEGGIAFAGETLGDFIDDSGEDFRTLSDLNKALKSCGIKEIKKVEECNLNEAKLVDRKTFGGIHNIFGKKVWVTGELSDTRDYRWEDVRIEDASGDLLGFGRYKWLNRPWQRFTYDVAFTKAVRDAFGDTAAKKADEAVENSSSIEGALKWLEEHEEKDECLTEDSEETKDKLVIYKSTFGDTYYVTPKSNYNTFISDARKIHAFDKNGGFESSQDIIDTYVKYGIAKPEDFEVIDECLTENVTVYRVVDDNTGDTMDFENRRDAVDFARKKGLYAVKVTLNDEGDVVNESVISDRIRKGDLDYEDEVDAYSVKDGDTYVQFQDRETRETRLKGEKDKWGNLRITGREDRQPRVSSHTIARIWKKDKDGKVTFDRVEGPKYLVRQDVARMFDKDESLTEADVTDQVIIDTHKDGFLTKKAELRDKGYKTLWVGNGKICMYKPKEAVTEGVEYYPIRRYSSGRNSVPNGGYSTIEDAYVHATISGYDEVAKETTRSATDPNPEYDYYSLGEVERMIGKSVAYKNFKSMGELEKFLNDNPDWSGARNEYGTFSAYKFLKDKNEGLSEAHKEQADEDAVRELVLYAENDSRIYHNKTLPVIANLKRKVAKGVFDKELAVKAFQYVADDAAKQYKKEFPAEDDGTYDYNFNPATREEVARQLLDRYMEQIEEK